MSFSSDVIAGITPLDPGSTITTLDFSNPGLGTAEDARNPVANGTSGWDTLGTATGNLLSSLATGFGQGLGAAVGGGRTPTAQIYANPLAQNPGGVGQPGTTPTAVNRTGSTGSLIPGVSNTVLIVGGVALAGLVLLVALKK